MENEKKQLDSKPLSIGDFGPDFTLDSEEGPLTLSDYRGKNVVLYFYPKDSTPGCTKEAEGFSARKQDFEDIDTVIIGVSKDTVDSHKKFADKYNLSVTLASDNNSTVCEAYDCWVEKNMYGKKYMGIQRDTFLIDAKGQIRKIWRKVKVDGHVEEVYEQAKKLS